MICLFWGFSRSRWEYYISSGNCWQYEKIFDISIALSKCALSRHASLQSLAEAGVRDGPDIGVKLYHCHYYICLYYHVVLNFSRSIPSRLMIGVPYHVHYLRRHRQFVSFIAPSSFASSRHTPRPQNIDSKFYIFIIYRPEWRGTHFKNPLAAGLLCYYATT